MGVFTLELYKVLDLSGVTLDSNGDYNIIDWSVLGLHDYPLTDNSHRDTINKKIVNRYLNREIGHETIERWRHAMRRKMHEIMPAYDELYKTIIDFEPLRTVDMKTIMESERDSSGSSSSLNEAGALSRAINLDFPQFALADNADYATSGADNNATNSATGTVDQEESGSGRDETTVQGYSGSPAELLMRARAAIINIDLAILDDLNELFMIVWDNGDEWLPSNWKGLSL